MAFFGNFETSVEPLASLMREHIETHELIAMTQEAIETALRSEGEAEPTNAAMEALVDLDAYLAEDLVRHIAKEEEVLFPALVGLAADLDKVVDEMVEQHDEVRLRSANLERALNAVMGDHAEVDNAKTQVSAAIAEARAGLVGTAHLANLLDAVKRLSWILQGHFGDEEDDLFPPTVALLSVDVWERLARAADEIDRRGTA